MPLGAIAGAIGGAAKGFGPALGNVMSMRQNQRQHDDTLAAGERRDASTAQYRHDTLAQTRSRDEGYAQYREDNAVRDHTYRLASLEAQTAREAIVTARTARDRTNRITDMRTARAERTAQELTDHLGMRPVRDDDTSPDVYRDELARWEGMYERIIKIGGFRDEVDIQEAMEGLESTHLPQESGGMRVNPASGAPEDGYQRLLRLQEESGAPSMVPGRGYGDALSDTTNIGR